MDPTLGGISSPRMGTHDVNVALGRCDCAPVRTKRRMNDNTTVFGDENQRKQVAVIMQRRAVDNRWQSEVWEPVGVLSDYEGAVEPPVIVQGQGITQWLYPAFDVVLCRSEAEGYFHNVSTAAPNVCVLWRMEDGRAVPRYVTVSYDEASRWMDGGAQVDSVVMPPPMCGWVRCFVAQYYRPEPKKRIRPRSFIAPKDRAAADAPQRP